MHRVGPDADGKAVAGEEIHQLGMRVFGHAVVVFHRDPMDLLQRGGRGVEENVVFAALAIHLEQIAAGDIELAEGVVQREAVHPDRCGGILPNASGGRAVLDSDAGGGPERHRAGARADRDGESLHAAYAVQREILLQQTEGFSERFEGKHAASGKCARGADGEIAQPGADIYHNRARAQCKRAFLIYAIQAGFLDDPQVHHTTDQKPAAVAQFHEYWRGGCALERQPGERAPTFHAAQQGGDGGCIIGPLRHAYLPLDRTGFQPAGRVSFHLMAVKPGGRRPAFDSLPERVYLGIRSRAGWIGGGGSAGGRLGIFILSRNPWTRRDGNCLCDR